MATAWVQGGSAAVAGATSFTFTYASNVTAASTLIGSVQVQGGGTLDATVADNRNGSWTADNALKTSDTNNAVHGPFRRFNAAAGSTTVTVTGNGGFFGASSFGEFSGLGTGPTVNVKGTTSGSSAAPLTSSFTPAAGDFVFVGYAMNASETSTTANSGWLDGADATHHELRSTNPNGNSLDEDCEYQLSAAGSAIQGGFTVPTSSTWAICWATYTPGSATAAAAGPQMVYLPRRVYRRPPFTGPLWRAQQQSYGPQAPATPAWVPSYISPRTTFY